MNKEIPARAFIEQQVLGHAEKKGALNESARAIERQYKLTSGFLGTGINWQTRILSLLYTLILFPKEFWKMKHGHSVFEEVGQQFSLDNIVIITEDNTYGRTVYGFIHRLRNALAHANIHFQGEHIEIVDFDRTGQEVYRARITITQVKMFLETVGAIMANQRNAVVS